MMFKNKNLTDARRVLHNVFHLLRRCNLISKSQYFNMALGIQEEIDINEYVIKYCVKGAI